MTHTLSPETPTRAGRKTLFAAAKLTACLIIVGFVGWTLTRQLRLVNWSQVRFAPIPSIISIAALFGVSVMQLIARLTLLRAYGYDLSWRANVATSWISQLGKYVPGGIASVGSLVYLLRKYNIPGAVSLAVAVLIDAMAVTAGLIVSAPLLFWQPVRQRFPYAWFASIAIVIVGVVLLHPRVFVTLLNTLLIKLKRQPIPSIPRAISFLPPVLASFGQWVFAGLALWFMALTITPIGANQIPFFIASAALAMTISYLVPFTPGGIGIREWVYYITLQPIIGPQAALVALVLRVLQTIMEIALAIIGLISMRNSPAQTASP